MLRFYIKGLFRDRSRSLMPIIVVAIGCGTGVLTEYLKNKREAEEFEPDEDVFQELESLRARVEVLEAIVTDQKYHLEKEIGSVGIDRAAVESSLCRFLEHTRRQGIRTLGAVQRDSVQEDTAIAAPLAARGPC